MRATILNYFLSTFMILAVSTPVTASPPSVLFESLPYWVETISVGDGSSENIDGSIKYLLLDNQVDIRTEEKSEFFHYVTTPINEQGLINISQIEVTFSPEYEKLAFHELKVVRNGKTINKLDRNKLKVFQQEEQLQDNLYNESWVALFILEDIRVDDIIDYSYSIIGTNPVLGSKNFGASPLSWSVPVENTNFRLVSDPKNPIDLRIYNSEKEVVKKETSGAIEYTLQQKDVAAVRMDDDAPAWFNPFSYLSYTEYNDWSKVNNWAQALYSKNYKIPADLIEVLDKRVSSDRIQSAANLAQWVQDNIRYFGIELGVNSHQPSLPGETLNRRYGDCKDKSVLLIAILKHYNINAYPVLVSTTTSKMLSDSLPSPGAFNHVIVTFNIDGKDYWIDATMTNQRGNLEDMSFPDYYWGLVIKDNTSQLSPIKTNSEKQLRGKIEVVQNLKLGSKDIKNELVIKTKYTGWQAEQIRTYIDEVGVNVSSQDHLDYLAKYFPVIREREAIQVDSDVKSNSFLTTETYYIDNMVNKQTNQLFIYANQIIDNVWLPSIRQRSAPFTLPYYLDVTIDTTVIAESPEDIIWFGDSEETNSKWFSYSRYVQKSENELSIKYEYHSLLPEVSAAEFSQYATLLEGIENSLNFSLRLRKEQSNAESNARAKSLVKMLMNKNK